MRPNNVVIELACFFHDIHVGNVIIDKNQSHGLLIFHQNLSNILGAIKNLRIVSIS